MEIDDATLSLITKIYPGYYAVYEYSERALRPLSYSVQLASLSGLTEAEYDRIGRNDALALVAETDREPLTKVLAGVIVDQREGELTYRIINKDRGYVWVHAKGRMIGTRKGAPVLMVSFNETSTEASEQTELLDHTPALIYVVDRKTHDLLFANSRAEDCWGRHHYDGTPCYKYINDRDEVCPWCQIPKMRDGMAYGDDVLAGPKNQWFSVDCRAVDWHGRDAAAIYARDITEQHNSRQQLMLDKDSLDAIVKNIPVGLGVCETRDGKIMTVSMNPQMEDLLGISNNGTSFFDSSLLVNVHPDDREAVKRQFISIAEPGHCQFEYRFRRRGQKKYSWYHAQTNTQPALRGIRIFVSVTDITSEKAVDDQLIEIRHMYEMAVKDARLVVWEYDIAHHRILMANNEFTNYDYRKFGLPQVIDNVPESLLAYIDDRYVPAFLEMYRKIGDGEPSASCDVWYKLQFGSGEPRCEHVSYTTVYDEKGRPIKAYGMGQNITARMLEKENYNRLYKQLTANLEQSVGSFQLNLSRNLYLNGYSLYPKVVESLARKTADEHFRATAETVTDPEIRKQILDDYNCQKLIDQFRSGTDHLLKEYPVTTAAGQTMWIRSDLYMMQNPDTGDIEGITHSVDVTAQKKNEEVIEHLSHEKFDYIAILDLHDATIEFVSKKVDTGFGKIHQKNDYQQWQLYYQSAFVPTEEQEEYRRSVSLETISGAMISDGSYIFSFEQNEHGLSSRRQLQYSWLNEKLGQVLLVRTDVTAAYNHEQEQLKQLKAALQQAEQASKAKTEFVSRISHDIRTPIGIITNMTGFARADLDDREKLIHDLDRIEASNTFLLSLINDVLDISKIDSGKVSINPEPYSYAEHNANIRNVLGPMCEAKGLRWSMERRNLTKGIIVVDTVRINQIVLNLISNSVKYTSSGGSVTYISDSMDLPDARMRFGFIIRDTGIGMSAGFQQKMFEPFTQEYDNPQRPKGLTGTGLGLSIVKRNVELLGGTMSVRSEQGAGTEISCYFVFPDATRDPRYQPLLKQRQKLGRERPAPLAGKVLLVEDNDINAEIALRILGSFGMPADRAEDGKKAVARFAGSSLGEYAAILMDIQMPLMNGYEATKAIRGLKRPDAREVPIIAMTADAFQDATERAYAAGMNDYLTKPLDAEAMREKLASHLKYK